MAEPLVHFLALGAAIFIAATVVKANARPTLHISRQEIAQLGAYWQAQMQREPTSAELNGLVRERIDEEILAAEAKRLGMDNDDLIIRRRLAQKMSFATEDVSDAKEPAEAELLAWYRAHPQDYETPSQVAIRQVFFSGDRGPAAQAQAKAALAVLEAGRPVTGDPSVLPLTYANVSLEGLARDFGEDFVQLAASAPLNHWSGPVRSGFGWHLIRVESRSGAVIAPFTQV
ncbi:MAG TPA: peptidylprolyl isomerase, partial [Caulobacteraceae bacterium]|nr:peptidylprolyl isomerase [Caulobacteraceae bacterium]